MRHALRHEQLTDKTVIIACIAISIVPLTKEKYGSIKKEISRANDYSPGKLDLLSEYFGLYHMQVFFHLGPV